MRGGPDLSLVERHRLSVDPLGVITTNLLATSLLVRLACDTSTCERHLRAGAHLSAK